MDKEKLKVIELNDEELEKVSGGIGDNNGPKFAKGKSYFDGEMWFTVVDFRFSNGTWIYILEHWDNITYRKSPRVIERTEAQLDS